MLLRVGFDMGKDFAAMHSFRLRAGLESIRYLLERGAFIVLLNHNGRPGGREVSELSNKVITVALGKTLGRSIPLFPLSASSRGLPLLPLLFLENLRFNPGEEANDSGFAKMLAGLGSVYINDAFSVSHRAHASLVALPPLLPHFGGLCLKREIGILRKVEETPEHPLLLIIGGVKIETKMKIIKRFWDKAEGIILGGALANTFLHVKGVAVGKSIIEVEHTEDIENISLTDTRLHLPVDVRVAKDFEGSEGVRVAPMGKLGDDEIILDIGPDTELLFDEIVRASKMVLWNGPMGKFEVPQFREGTERLLTSLLESSAKVITGGGETVEFLEEKGMLDKFYFVSTGGGAMLTFLAGDPMPGLDALE